ncbi:hypothetical protein X975_09165, partial [Stegodyphus mimosarum]
MHLRHEISPLQNFNSSSCLYHHFKYPCSHQINKKANKKSVFPNFKAITKKHTTF